MFHLVAYKRTGVAGETDADMAAVQDVWLTISNSHFVLMEPMRLLMAYGLGTTLDRLKISTPSLRTISLPYIVPIEPVAAVPDLPAVAIFQDHELILPPIDEIALLESNTDAGAQTYTAMVWLGFGPDRNTAPGPVYTVRATGTITAVTGAWTQGAITLDQTLPAGTYAIVGMSVIGTNLMAARLALPKYKHRPGCLARTAVANDDRSYWRMGRMGILGDFDSIAQPQLDIYALGANTAQTVYLDLVKIR